MDGQPTKWIVKEGALEPVKGSGYIRTLQSFGACQLHVEFATPKDVQGSSQGRGNSGVFFGMGKYEVQILDSYQNPTYADGSCGAIYNQFPPSVNVSRPPGEWQTYDIIWTPPMFDDDGKLTAPAYLTVIHNGVVIHANVALIGETGWVRRPPFKQHPEKLPIALQDHGNPVRFRNIWVRELGRATKPEFYLPETVLNGYVGKYEDVEVTRKDSNLIFKFGGSETVMFAESPTQFFAKVVDIQATFDPQDKSVMIGVGEPGYRKRKKLE